MRGPAEFWLVDMDGALITEEHALPGSAEFLQRLAERQRRYLVLTNNSIFTPRDLAARLASSGELCGLILACRLETGVAPAEDK